MENLYDYDVAFSFAGEDREIARAVAAIAQANHLRVFIDEEHLWESWGKNLNEYLQDIYSNKSQFCVIFISKDYCEKAYTNAERRYALDRVLHSKTEYLLPLRIDNSWPDGLPLATAFLDLRKMSVSEAATIMVKKVKGPGTNLIIPPQATDSKIIALAIENTNDKTIKPNTPNGNQALSFASIQTLEECKGWREIGESECSGNLCWRTGDYDDPIFDITIINTLDKPVLLTAVGLKIVQVRCEGMKIMGGDRVQTVNLHRTYKIGLPDMWSALALKLREIGLKYDHAINVNELAKCRLPDPVFIEPYRPYRYGLHLFDYVSFCPNYLELRFWARTDKGECLSEKATLTYSIGRVIPPLSRYMRIFYGDEEVRKQEERALHYFWPAGEKQNRLQSLAYFLWEKEGRPNEKEKALWIEAEKQLSAELLAEDDLRFMHKRPFE